MAQLEKQLRSDGYEVFPLYYFESPDFRKDAAGELIISIPNRTTPAWLSRPGAVFLTFNFAGIYSGDREIISRKDEIKLTIQQQFARHLPLPVKNAVKRFMTKRGHRYYSDMKE